MRNEGGAAKLRGIKEQKPGGRVRRRNRGGSRRWNTAAAADPQNAAARPGIENKSREADINLQVFTDSQPFPATRGEAVCPGIALFHNSDAALGCRWRFCSSLQRTRHTGSDWMSPEGRRRCLESLKSTSPMRLRHPLVLRLFQHFKRVASRQRGRRYSKTKLCITLQRM